MLMKDFNKFVCGVIVCPLNALRRIHARGDVHGAISLDTIYIKKGCAPITPSPLRVEFFLIISARGELT